MKKTIILLSFLLLTFATLIAFTPIIDGTKDDGWGATPTNNSYTTMEPTNFNLDGGCYVTNDANYVYIGIPTDLDPWNDGASIHMHVAIDTKNTAAGGTFDAWGSSIKYAQPYLPDYDIITQWNYEYPNAGWTGLQTWNGTGWTQTQLTTIAGGGGQFTEIKIAFSDLGNIAIGQTINISVWLRPDWGKNGASSCLPADAGFAADWGNGWQLSCTNQFPYLLTEDEVLPVELSSFTAITFNETTVSIQWISQSETDLMGYNVYRNMTHEVNTADKLNSQIIGATNSSTTHTYSLQDTELIIDNTYFYWLESVNMDGTNEMFGPISVYFSMNQPETPIITIPTATALLPAYPNPFNPNTTLSIRLETGAQANLNVFNVKGELIKHIFNGVLTAGTYRWNWDGTDLNGKSVGSGVYYYRLDAGKYHQTNKMVLMK
jgi:hypothetical protein